MTQQLVTSHPTVQAPTVPGLRHDLRHALATVQALLAAADAPGDLAPERVRALVSGAHGEAGLALTLLDSLLALVEAPTAVPAGDAGARTDETCDLVAVLEAAAVVVQGLGRTVPVRAARPLRAPLSSTAATRVVRNLVSNAVKATRPGGIIELRGLRVDYSGRVARDGTFVRLEVHDDGPGIPAAGLYRPGAAGLSVVRSLVLPVGGWLVIGRSPHGGACVSVTLPSPAVPGPAVPVRPAPAVPAPRRGGTT
jgi:signal transduction histidine kinase